MRHGIRVHRRRDQLNNKFGRRQTHKQERKIEKEETAQELFEYKQREWYRYGG